MKCGQDGCEYLAAAKSVTGGRWEVTRLTVGHSCERRKPRARQYKTDVLVAGSAPVAVASVVSVMGRDSNRAKDLMAMVSQRTGIQLRTAAAHRFMAKRKAGSKTAFLDELQILQDVLKQMREQDSEGKDHARCVS